MSRKYKKKRTVYRIDETSSPFYVYCLFWSNKKEDIEYKEKNVFYVGKAKNKEFDCLRRENKHLEEAYRKSHWNFHKSRKIRTLEENGKFIMSKILEEFENEFSAYEAELKWYNFFKNKGLDLTNMVECGNYWVGSGESHPSYDFKIRKKSKDIKKLYTEDLWSIQKIAKKFKKSSKIIKQILFKEGVEFREKYIKHPLWLKTDEILEKYNNGYSLNKLTKEYKGSVNFFSNMLKDLGCKIRGTESYKKRANAWNYVNDILRLYNNGNTLNSLCKKYNCDVCVIKKILKENNIQTKKRLFKSDKNV
jgi:DNA invertase Pin-like site-specific DNA recombinase